MLRADNPVFRGFGEIYFSEITPGAVKAWKRHKRMTQRLAVPIGRIRLVIHDDREDSPTKGCVRVIELGRPDAYRLVVIPPLLWYGFSSIGEHAALIANCTDLPHDPFESETLDPAAAAGRIPYAWH
jgi:dTDP-4-dehydrorhamnose 3,5-epimerase